MRARAGVPPPGHAGRYHPSRGDAWDVPLKTPDAKAERGERTDPQDSELPFALTGVGEVCEPRDEDTAMVGVVLDNRYRITGVLGRGAMGSVYRAEHVLIRRPVALKVLHEGLETVPELSARFEREAFAIGRINHPNCVAVFDVGKLERGSPYIALELVHGESLADVLERDGRIAPHRALSITRHVLRGLAHAHEQGIVHRDVKPDNIVLTERDGDPDFAKILDFGIASLEGEAETLGGGEKLTHAGTVCGTPQYMSPEQIAGASIDVRSDLYAAAVVLFEMIAGRPPFDDDDPIVVSTMHTSAPPPSLAEIVSDVVVPSGTESLLGRALAKWRDDRFANAEAMIEAIDACLEGDRAPTIPAGEASQAAGRAAREARTPASSRVAKSVREAAATVLQRPARPAIDRVLPRPHRFARWGLPLIAAVALLTGGAWWLALRDSGPSKLAIAAAERLERGDPEGAIAVLDRAGEALDDDPHAQLQRGHAHASRHEDARAVDAYERAIALRGELRDNPLLQTNLELFLDASDPEVKLGAAELLIRELDKEAAADRLVELASSAEIPRLRHGALTLAEDLGLDEGVDRTRSFSLDLAQGETCDERRKAVARLRALGDPDALPALRKILRRNRDEDACLREDAKAAFRYLKAIAQAGQKDAGPSGE